MCHHRYCEALHSENNSTMFRVFTLFEYSTVQVAPAPHPENNSATFDGSKGDEVGYDSDDSACNTEIPGTLINATQYDKRVHAPMVEDKLMIDLILYWRSQGIIDVLSVFAGNGFHEAQIKRLAEKYAPGMRVIATDGFMGRTAPTPGTQAYCYVIPQNAASAIKEYGGPTTVVFAAYPPLVFYNVNGHTPSEGWVKEAGLAGVKNIAYIGEPNLGDNNAGERKDGEYLADNYFELAYHRLMDTRPEKKDVYDCLQVFASKKVPGWRSGRFRKRCRQAWKRHGWDRTDDTQY
jgi:hypothetical protein